ncbi:MAG: hypothetical protein ACI97K_002397 [Glaciecola sp.]|jgi:hypothetical protein
MTNQMTLLNQKFNFLLLSTLLMVASASYASGTKSVKPEYVYTPLENPLIQAQKTLEQAAIADKYALIVLGAQWCHDSVGLAENFSTEQMQTILSERFVTTFIDVGYLEDRRELTNLVGYPNYFATPTVLIVDPKTGELMNIDSLSTWQSAASVDIEDYVEHYSAWNKPKYDIEAHTISSLLPKEIIGLAEFEKQQSARLQNAYAALGPLLEASDNTKRSERTKEQRKQFLDLWNEVKLFRTLLQADIHDVRASQLSPIALAAKLEDSTPSARSWEQ